MAVADRGRVQGRTAAGVHTFLGIPYGADTARYRFQPPVKAAAWKGIRPATDFAPRAPQLQPSRDSRDPKAGYHLPPDEGAESEDCLHLNVFTPALADGKKRPVLVYFHGGGYNNGTVNSVLYDGANLCRRGDVVVITVNHRLNALGHLFLAEAGGAAFADSGNAGMLDLVLALEWVRDNAAAFGGDPGCVTIFGQSGGGAKCATLMAMPAARGLFHRVITMSGQQITASRRESATARTAEVLRALGLRPGSIDAIRTIPLAQLLQAARTVGYYGPVKDGRSLPRDPFDPDAPVQSALVPMLLGNTHDETRLLIGGGRPELFGLGWDAVPEALQKNVGQFLGALAPAGIVRAYRELYPAYSPSDVFFAATTAARSWRGQVIEAERRAADPVSQKRSWVYQFDWASPVDGGKWGAPHTIDIAFAFDNTGVSPGVVGAGDPNGAAALAAVVSDTFLAFARNGNPNHAGLPGWDAFEPEQRMTMLFDRQSRAVKDPRGAERRLFAEVPYTQPGT